MLCSLLNDWNYFLKKYCNLLFLTIFRSQFPFLIFLASSWQQRASLQDKWLWLIIILKGFIKQPVTKESPTFLSFYFLIDRCMCFSSFLMKAFVNFEKLIRLYQQAFIVCKNGENLKILIEIFRQKVIVSNVIMAFLNHLKPKIVFIGQPWQLT